MLFLREAIGECRPTPHIKFGRRNSKHFNALFYGGISVSKSKVCLILSAFIYGFAPILAKFAYKSGANGITLTFLRTFLMLPLLFFIMLQTKVKRKSITNVQFTRYLIASHIGYIDIPGSNTCWQRNSPFILLYLTFYCLPMIFLPFLS